MSTERRALIAMVLMLVVLLFYWMYAPNRSRSPEPAAPETASPAGESFEQTAASPESAAGSGLTADGATSPLDLDIHGGPGEDVDVETPLVSAVLNTTGGVVTSSGSRTILAWATNPSKSCPNPTAGPSA